MNLEYSIISNTPGLLKLYRFLRKIIPNFFRCYQKLRAFPQPSFHDDKIFQDIIKKIVLSPSVSSFTETGTYYGFSTEYIATLRKDIPIFSCEINEKLLKKSKKWLREFKNVKISESSSPNFLKKLVNSGSLGNLPVFFLDAHGSDNYWPLKDEIRIITSSFQKAIIIIDDFKVPNRPEFGFDIYNKKTCGLKLIKSIMNKKNSYYALLPQYSYIDAFGNNRNFSLTGYIVVFQNSKEEFKKIYQGNNFFIKKFKSITF